MLNAGKQLDDQNSDLASYISDLCGKVERNNKYPEICHVIIPHKYRYTSIQVYIPVYVNFKQRSQSLTQHIPTEV